MSDRVAVIGAGSWGTAVGTIVGASRPASLWVRSPELAATMVQTRRNEKYLPDVQLPDGLTVTSSLAEALDGANVVFMAVPSHGFRAVLTDMQPLAGGIEAVVSLAKGIEMGTNLRMSQVVAEVLPGYRPASSPARTWPAKWRTGIRPPASSPCPTKRWRAACRRWCTHARSVPIWAPTSSGARSPAPRRTSWRSRPASATGWGSGTTPVPS